jgi:polysaccharide export outer membrane protein
MRGLVSAKPLRVFRGGGGDTLKAALRACSALLIAALFFAVVSDAEEYIVGEGDLLQVTVLTHPDLTTSARVSRDGQIRLPLIGQVFVAGIALPRIADVISGRLANGYLVDPQVTVSVQEYRTLKATVIGMVNHTGVYEFRDRLTFLELLSRAGGLSPDADNSAVVTSRSGESRTVDLRGLLTQGNLSLDIEIRDGDRVFVAPAPKISIAGEVRRAGEYRHEPGMTAIRAVNLAGGLSPDADSRAVITNRSGESRTVDLRVQTAQGGATTGGEIHDGDSIFIASAGRLFITGEVRRPGEYRFEEGTTTNRAVTLAGGYSEHAVTDRLKVIRTENGQERIIEVGADAVFPLRRSDIIVVSALRAEVCYLTGEVKNAGAFRCDRETNVLKAVALAGGFTDAAAKNKIRIVRRVDGQEQVHEKVSLEEPVLPDDILVIPKSFF